MSVHALREQFAASIASLPYTAPEPTPARLVAALLRFQAIYGQRCIQDAYEIEDDHVLARLDRQLSDQRREVRRLIAGLGLSASAVAEAV